jgi:hypothetical protein
MSKKIIVLIAFILLVNLSSDAQTSKRASLQETKDWIINKFFKYGTGFWPTGSNMSGVPQFKFNTPGQTFSINFTDEGLLIILVTLSNYSTHDSDDNSDDYYTGTYCVMIPIYDIDVDKIERGIFTRQLIKSMKFIPNVHVHYSINNQDYYQTNTRYDFGVDLTLDYKREDNLLERMKEALRNLQYYYPKPKNTETF